MKRFVEGVDRNQSTLFPERLEDWIGEDNLVRVHEHVLEAVQHRLDGHPEMMRRRSEIFVVHWDSDKVANIEWVGRYEAQDKAKIETGGDD
jgi:hypothetical protein